uniref:Cadherin domain-containing protein n=1 Tax=Steinernema glaseri TaxID=37863 RepID=A0A1I7ZKE7_9BILA
MGTTVRVSRSLHADSLQILVDDLDLKPGMPDATYQYILSGYGAQMFGVDQQGYVYLNVPEIDADPPHTSTYQLIVEAREVGTIPIRSSEPISITIHIIDENDNDPKFSEPVYLANVSASGGERPVIKVFAVDNDVGNNSKISYHIIEVTGGAQEQFYYDHNTNELMVRGNLQPGARYQIVLEARDRGGRTNSTVIVALATEDNTFTPLLPLVPFVPTTTTPSTEDVRSFVTELDEASPPNSIVITLGGEAPSGLTYEIVHGNDDGKFTINPQTGTILTAQSFDREETASYTLQVETREQASGRHLYWTIIQVIVKDVNDNSPQFHGPQPMRMSMTIDELSELKPNMPLGRIVVTDNDEKDEVNGNGNGDVSLSIAQPQNRLFNIDNNGVVTVNGDLTTEHFGFHRLSVIASDHGEPPRKTHGVLLVNVGSDYVSEPTEAQSTMVTESASTENNELDMNPTTTLFTLATLPPTYPKPYIPEFPTTYGQNQNSITTGHEITTQEELGTTEQGLHETRPTPFIPRTTSFSSFPTVPFVETTRPPTTTVLRLAPVFNPADVSVTVKEREEQIELAKLHATYPDGAPGSITYVMQAGDPSLFSVSSFTGTLTLLRPLDAEAGENQYTVRIGTAESAGLAVDAQLPHSAEVTIRVADVNDWTPSFESDSYQFAISENTEPGTVVGQVAAFDQDRDEPNNKISYNLVSMDNMDSYFSVNEENGLVTLIRSAAEFVGQTITLRIEAWDHGEHPDKGQTIVLVAVEPAESKLIDKNPHQFTSNPSKGSVQFSLRNYTASVAEGLRPPHLVQVLSVLYKPDDSRFIMCSIVSGNFRGAFAVSPGPDGNCELRTNIALDRESVERYLLNVTVTSGAQTDFAFVSITVLDVNDNTPTFVYDNDLQLPMYFAGISSTAPALARVITVKAEDADLGNSSVVKYSLDPMLVDSKYFSINQFGEISAKQSMSHVISKNRRNFFELKAVACDSPVTGQTYCSKADVIVNLINDLHRFVTTIKGIPPQQFRNHEPDVIKTLRQFTGRCTLLGLEKMRDYSSPYDGQMMTDVYWYAVNPSTKKICRKQEYKKLFDRSTKDLVAGKLRPWFILETISDTLHSNSDSNYEKTSLIPSDWKISSTIVIVLGLAIALIALIAIILLCICYTRYKSSRSIHGYPDNYQFPKHPIYMPQTLDHNKIYETQMIHMPMSDEDMTLKNSSLRSNSHNLGRPNSWCDPRLPSTQRNTSRNYGRQHQIDEGDFSIEENMYAVNASSSIDPVTKCSNPENGNPNARLSKQYYWF